MRDQGEIFLVPERYRRLVGKLVYHSTARHDLSYLVGVLSQFMQYSHINNWNVVIHILKYVKGTP